MVAYQQFVELAQAGSSEARAQAAHLAARAFVVHDGPADEQAALYAALIGFLDDPSVKVRAALAYGVLHCARTPRPIVNALLLDVPVVARAVAQYSPALIDADLLGVVGSGDGAMLGAVAARDVLSDRLAAALIGRGERAVILQLLKRFDVGLGAALLGELAGTRGDDGELRGALLARKDLPGTVRLVLVEKAVAALRGARIVKGAVAPNRLDGLTRNALDSATSRLGESEAERAESGYVAQLLTDGKLSARLLLHALVEGRGLFFSTCLAQLAETPRGKVLGILGSGGRASLNALFARAGLGEAVRHVMARLVFLARTADLADDMAARHYVVTALIEALIVEHDGDIPDVLLEIFSYLSEQNTALGRRASRGVIGAFAGEVHGGRRLPGCEAGPALLALPAA